MKNNWLRFVIFGMILLAIFGGVYYWMRSRTSEDRVNTLNAEYNPVIDPNDFVSTVDNKYFTLTPGTKFTYEGKTDKGLERSEVFVTHEKRRVMDVTTIVVQDKLFLDDELLEDTKDWFAQDKQGNVWYFGEEVDNYYLGEVVDHEGAWKAGIDGAKPGIIMLANPHVGDSYHQEYQPYHQGKVAEDMGDVVALGKEVVVSQGTFDDCLQTRDWSKIDPSANEYKYYCPEVGFVVLEESIEDSEKKELVNVLTP